MAANLSFQLLLAKFFTFSSPSKALAFSSTASSESSASAGLLSPPPPPAAFLGLALAPAGFFAPPDFAVPGFWELEWNKTFEMTMVYNFVSTDRSKLMTQRPTSYIKRLQDILVWPTVKTRNRYDRYIFDMKWDYHVLLPPLHWITCIYIKLNFNLKLITSGSPIINTPRIDTYRCGRFRRCWFVLSRFGSDRSSFSRCWCRFSCGCGFPFHIQQYSLLTTLLYLSTTWDWCFIPIRIRKWDIMKLPNIFLGFYT